MIVREFQPTVNSYSAIIDGFAKTVDLDFAEVWLEELPDRVSIVGIETGSNQCHLHPACTGSCTLVAPRAQAGSLIS